MSYTINLTPTSPPSQKTSVEQKIKARNAALMLKNGSPKLRDLLREKCHIRMKDSRAQSFYTSRNITIEGKKLINTIVREELADIESDIELQDIIFKEILDNWDQWQNDEMEKSEMSYLEQIDTDVDQIFCPVCQRNLLNLRENIISCDCGLRLYYPNTLPEFFDRIQINVKIHEQRCNQRLQFFTEPKENFNVLSLNALCTSCEFFSPILGF